MVNPANPVDSARLLHDGAPIATGEQAITETASLLRAGEVVAIPTDTVYGLAAALDSASALQAIFRIKGRDRAQTLPVLASDGVAARLLVRKGTDMDWAVDQLLSLADRFWPGGLTVALSARSSLPPVVVATDGTVGIRVPDNVVARTLLGRTHGALAVTSANRSGAAPLTDATSVVRDLSSSGLHWVLDGGPAGLAIASTVVGRAGDELIVFRHGAIPEPDLQSVWAEIVETPGY